MQNLNFANKTESNSSSPRIKSSELMSSLPKSSSLSSRNALAKVVKSILQDTEEYRYFLSNNPPN